MAHNRTWIIDIDGVVFEQHGPPSDQWYSDPKPIKETVDLLNALEGYGDHIVLMTARPESLRDFLTILLRRHRVPYHQLVMGVTAGLRILVNDVKVEGAPPKAQATNVIRNMGMRSIA